MKNKWKGISWKDVGIGGSGSTSTHRSNSGGRGSRNRFLDTRSWSLTLSHTPTGCSVSGEIPPGNYSKNTMKTLTDKLQQQLFIELDKTVARHLRIPGK